jgi:hypothetical protein
VNEPSQRRQSGGWLATVFDVQTAILISGVLNLLSGGPCMPWPNASALRHDGSDSPQIRSDGG